MDEGYRLTNTNDIPEHIDMQIQETLGELSRILVKKHPSVAFAALSALVAAYIKELPEDMQQQIIKDFPMLIQRTIDDGIKNG